MSYVSNSFPVQLLQHQAHYLSSNRWYMVSSSMEDIAAIATINLEIALQPVSVPSQSPKASFSNWARTFHCQPQRVFAPTSAKECQMIVELARREGAIIHPVGVGHSPSDLACTNGWLIRMESIKGMVKVSEGGCQCSPEAESELTTFVGNRSITRNDPPPF